MEGISFIPAAILGFLTFHVTTKPKSSIWQNLPQWKIKRVQIFPSIRIYINDRIIHFHHWFNFAVLLIIANSFDPSFLHSAVTQGVLVGGMIQGLSVPEARKLIYKRDFYSPDSVMYWERT